MKYLYNIIDAKTMKLEHDGLKCQEVAEILNADPKAISWYSQNDKPLKGKIIISVLLDKTQAPKKQPLSSNPTSRVIIDEDGKKKILPLDLENDWNRFRIWLNPEAVR